MQSFNEKNFWWEIKIEGEHENLLSIADISGSIGSCFENDNLVKAYYLSSDTLENRLFDIEELLPHFPGTCVVGHGKIENRAWHTEWQDAFPPLDVGEGFVVLAPWHRGKEPADRVPLYIYPATAFGTGYHESTQIALTLLERNKSKFKGKKIADIGTGSGVLLIAALKLGALKGYARDIDPTVLDEVRNNLRENGLDDEKILLEVGDLLKDIPIIKVSVLTANILFEPLCSMLPDVAGILEADGVAIFAGLLARERDEFLRAASECGLALVDEITKNEWWGASFAR